ncbi:MAG: hypothetical protein U0228_18980 [Myxococcaceae bacterium]
MAAKKRRTVSKKSSPPPARRALHYKVVELSNVDEGALERTVNEWVPRGWTFDGVQFAMRESSKRPSMAFVFFTREGEALPADELVPSPAAFRADEEADAHLRRLARAEVAPPTTSDAWARLQALANAVDDEEGGSA